ncbi:phage tail-collar fiber domain-containing protein [Anaerotruncus rubiinfantis]|uniref:phage tail-collar fiber domain-containing protein n=1 Tax=Anaerotruncus rubiinfantis TaxID=1720200 RepID=UPI0034A341BD
MAETYMTLTTNACDAAVAAALAAGTTVTFKYLAVGDGGGSYYEPTKDQTVLRGEKWRGECTVSRDPGNAKRVIITASIPSNVGGFQVREAAVLLADGTMMVVSKQPLSDKVAPSSGAGKDMTIQLYVEVVDQVAVTIIVDPSAQWTPLQNFNAHAENADIHTTAAEKSAINTHMADEVRHISAIERQAWNGKADPSDLITITLPVASWVKDNTREMWTQAVTHSSIMDGVRIGISVDDDTQLALMDAGVTLRIDNNNGTATAKAFGAIPEGNITVQLTLTPVEVVA